MKRICFALGALLVMGITIARADQTTADVQQALKDQGFYYGDVDGKKSADTTSAIRRYQIRNGLQITGEIDAETLRSLGIGSRGSARAVPRTPPSGRPESESRDDEEGQSAEVYPGPTPPAPNNFQRPPGSVYSPPAVGPYGPRPEGSAVFAGTPYQIAPPDLQRHVIVGAQTLLMRFGYYRSGVDGQFGPGTEAAVRAFQARSGLVVDGRLNMETLGALGLLPGQHPRGYPVAPRRVFPRPVYRGEWVPLSPYR